VEKRCTGDGAGRWSLMLLMVEFDAFDGRDFDASDGRELDAFDGREHDASDGREHEAFVGRARSSRPAARHGPRTPLNQTKRRKRQIGQKKKKKSMSRPSHNSNPSFHGNNCNW